MTNPKVLKPLFRKQASKWEGFGRAYLHRTVLMSSDVSIRILEEVCLEFGIPNHRKRELKDIILGFEDAGEKRILEKLRGFWQDTLAFPLQTNNELFVQKVKEAQHLRFRSALERYRKKKTTNDFIMSLGHHEHEIVIVKQILETRKEVLNSWTIVDSNDLNELFQQMHPRGVQNTEDEIHDLLKAYYEVSPSRIPNCACAQQSLCTSYPISCGFLIVADISPGSSRGLCDPCGTTYCGAIPSRQTRSIARFIHEVYPQS